MTLLFMDGFDAADGSVKWEVPGSYGTGTSTRFSTGRFCSNGGTMQKYLAGSSEITVGYALFVNGFGSALIYSDAGATTHMGLTINGGGFLQVNRGGTAIAVGTNHLVTNSWTYIEWQVTISDTVGKCIVHINGDPTPDINFTGDTRNAGTSTTIDRVGFNNINFDDVYILDNTGTTNTTFLGDVRIHTLMPSGNGTDSQLTGSDADQVNNYLLVDELPYSSTDYNGSPTTGLRDTYAIGNLPANVTQVFGVQNNAIIGKSDASFAQAKNVLRTGGSLYYGATVTLSTTYVDYFTTYNVNPDTTVAWTISDVNGLEAGMEVA